MEVGVARERQTDKERERQRETDRQTDRDRQTERERERRRERTDRQRQRDGGRELSMTCPSMSREEQSQGLRSAPCTVRGLRCFRFRYLVGQK